MTYYKLLVSINFYKQKNTLIKNLIKFDNLEWKRARKFNLIVKF